MLSRNTIFAHPKRTSAILGVSSVFLMLIPTCLKLIPLVDSRKKAENELDDANNNFATTLQKLNTIHAHIAEDQQRILDLDCAMQGYSQFNEVINNFQERINNSTATPIDLLKSFWQIQFSPDKTTRETIVTPKDWEEWKYKYEYYYSCFTHDCGKDSDGETISCCWDWDWHWVKVKYSYVETTVITNIFKNIITGSPLKPFFLDCGYYSRQFQTFSPENFESFKSPPIASGDDRESSDGKSGATMVTYNREFASRIKLSYLLDEVRTDSIINVLNNVELAAAAFALSEKLEQFLSYAIAALM